MSLREFFTVNFWKERPLRYLCIVGGGFFLVSLFFVALKGAGLSTPVILHFDHFNGIDLFGDRASLWGVWFLGLVMGLVNAAFSEFFFYRSRVLSYVFLAANFFISILLLVAVSLIITVN